MHVKRASIERASIVGEEMTAVRGWYTMGTSLQPNRGLSPIADPISS